MTNTKNSNNNNNDNVKEPGEPMGAFLRLVLGPLANRLCNIFHSHEFMMVISGGVF